MVNLGCHYYPKMSSCVVLQQPQTLKKNSISPSSSSLPYYNKNQPTSSSSSGKISPAILFIIIIIAVIFFISGVLHLLVRLLTKQRRSSSTTTTTTQQNEEVTGSFQRQLQQLFHLHDSGLDQAFIDALPVFLYRDIMGLEEPFDCAVCLSEFSHQDSLRLLPLCTHAFHVGCIDTWLLSNSTCPLCRGSLHLPIENPVFYHGEEEDYGSSGVVAASEGSAEIHKRVFSVRLGKFRSINGVGMVSKQQQQEEEEEEEEKGESSSSSCRLELDSRRCYSMGSYQYVVADSDLQVVALRPPKRQHNNNNNSLRRVVKERAGGGDSEGKKIINIGTKGDSFSVSKIWQWPRKGKSTPTTLSQQPHLPWNNNMSLNSHEPL